MRETGELVTQEYCCLKYGFRGVIQPRNTKVEDLKRPGSQQVNSSLLLNPKLHIPFPAD